MIKPFKFKEFTVNQDRCAMKIGTDSVLLGAWTSLDSNPFSVLDIGAGTGVLSLMLAQRSSAEIIDAIEIDDKAYEQCVDNFEQSPWGDRLFCYHASLEEFADEIEDWIIDALKNIGCDSARSVLDLSRDELIRRTDLEDETIDDVLKILSSEFED